MSQGRRRQPADIKCDTDAVEQADVPRRDFLTTHGACADTEPGTFFPPITYNGEREHWNTGPAKAVCGSCLIRIPCLAFANSQGSILNTRGVWGGRSRDERKSIANALRYRERTRARTAGLP